MHFLKKKLRKVNGLVHVFFDKNLKKCKGVSPCIICAKNWKKGKGLVHALFDQKIEKSKGVSPCIFCPKNEKK